MTGSPLLEVDGLSKRFAHVVANDAVSFRVWPGEIHALLGENGAGKSTLVKMIYGVLRPDGGSMRLDGAHFAPRRPGEARARGVGMVFQHFSLFDGLTVTENIALALAGARADAALSARLAAMATTYGLAIDPGCRVGTLSVGERQRVEILRCLAQDPRLVVLDEPTSVLTPQEAEALFVTLRRLTTEGRSVLYISHKLDEVRGLCHHATVLRAGKVVATCVPGEQSTRALAAMMLGGEIAPVARVATTPGPLRLSIRWPSDPVSDQHSQTPPPLAPFSLDVRAGEIVGIAGIAGNGQDALMTVLTGEYPAAQAEAIRIDGRAIGHLGVTERRIAGMAFVPEERLGRGAVAELSLADNVLLTARDSAGLLQRGFIGSTATSTFAARIVADNDVRTAGVGHAASSHSGGNLQKFVVGRELALSPRVLVVAQPTWGVDAGAQAAIHSRLLSLSATGCAIVVISQDLDELLVLADRIAVIARGRVSTAMPTAELTVEAMGLAMAGGATPAPSQRSPAHA